MKTILCTTLLSLFCFSSVAFADWIEDFLAIFSRSGIDPAVERAFKDGVAPVEIVKMTQQTGGVEPAAVIKALYCAGVSGTTVQTAASEGGVSNADVAAGYKQSVGQCSPAAALNPDPFSRAPDIASKGSPVGERGESQVVLPPVIDGGGTRPPSVSPDRF